MTQYNTLAKISKIVGVKASAVAMFLSRYLKDGKLVRKKAKTGHSKVSAAGIEHITTIQTLERQRHMTM